MPSVKLSTLAKTLNTDTAHLRKKVVELGFTVKPKALTVPEDVAAKLTAILEEESAAPLPPENLSKADLYEEMIDEEMDREIIKQQRKMTAGKEKPAKAPVKKMHEKIAEKKVSNGAVEIPENISVKEFAEKLAVSPIKIIGELMKNGILANINQMIDYDTAAIIASDLQIPLKRKQALLSAEDLFARDLEKLLKEDNPEQLKPRPPVVSVMGHVDHGKTSLLDAIRKTNVTASEAGGITQHIGAYQVFHTTKKGEQKAITFLDTPGHAAFTAMRARGAKATDIAILVVAADEGVMPQTEEAINHAKDAGIPIIVAINKIDKPTANLDKIKGELAQHGLNPEEWGGDTIMVPVSATTKQGIEQLLEMILLVAELQNLRANPNRPAVATVIEAHLDASLGPVATVVVNTGTLHTMDFFVVGSTHGRVKRMTLDTKKVVTSITPSQTAQIAGLEATPVSGDILTVVKDAKAAREQVDAIQRLTEAHDIKQTNAGLGGIIAQIHAGQLKTLKIVLKADTKGSLEALRAAIVKIATQEVGVKIIHSGVGSITESDVLMASASNGVVVGFHTDVLPHVESLAEREYVEILRYDVIYHLTDELKKLLTGLLEPETIRVILGKAEVMQVFFTEKREMIVGCLVREGKMENRVKVHVWRAGEQIGAGEIASLKRGKEATHEVKAENDCGIRFTGNCKLEVGDVLEAWKDEKKFRTL